MRNACPRCRVGEATTPYGYCPDCYRQLGEAYVASDLAEPVASGTHSSGASTLEIGLRTNELRVRTGAEITSMCSEKVRFIRAPYLARGAMTSLIGKPKAGKTDFALSECREVLDEGATRVLYVTEQAPGTLRPYLDRWGLTGREDFFIVFLHEVSALSWEALAQGIVRAALDRGAGLVVLDTFAQIARLQGEDENSAGAMLTACRPLQQAAAEHDLGVWILIHERKSGGNVADAGRGSGALAGAVDCLMLLRRPEGNVSPNMRVIESISRFDATPPTLAIERTEEGYRVVGDSAAVAAQSARTAIFGVVSGSSDTAKSYKDIFQAANVKPTVGRAVIGAMVRDGELRQAGDGVKNAPHVFWRPEIHSSATPFPVADERNQTQEGTL